MPGTEDAAAERDSINATLCNTCSKALQKPLVCARCKTAIHCSKDCQKGSQGVEGRAQGRVRGRC